MRHIRSFFAGIALLLIGVGAAMAQSGPGWSFGTVPTPAQWNAAFQAKQNWLGVNPCLVSGCTMTGEINLVPATAAQAGLNFGTGVAPSSPVNGDMWMTSSGLFYQANGTTYGPVNLTSATLPIVLSAAVISCPTCATATLNGAALTQSNDTNVTLTLGGTPATSLLNAVSLTMGWTGTLAVGRGGTGGGAASGTLLDNITGFSSTGFLTRTGAGTYAFQSTTNGISLGNIAQIAANSFLGNPGTSTANLSAFTPGSLTSKASPVAADLVVIADSAASFQLKQTTVSALASAGSVASIDAKTGAFTTSNGLDSTGGNVIELTAARRTLPTTQVFLSGSGTYTTAANVLWIEVQMVGGGGAGAGGNTTGTANAGNPTCWNTTGAACSTPVYQAGGGGGGNAGVNASAGIGGTVTGSGTPYLSIAGGGGHAGNTENSASSPTSGGGGGNSCLGGGGASSLGALAAGGAGAANSGGGGAGGGVNTAGVPTYSGSGGGAGACIRFIINNPAGTYTYVVGASVSGQAAGANGTAGGGGSAGGIWVIEHYGSWLLEQDLDGTPANDNFVPAFMISMAA